MPVTQQTTPTRRVAILGGGISGLSAAWYLQQGAQAAGSPLQYTVFEAAPGWGGKVQTEQVHGFGDAPFVIELGPDSFLTQKPWALQLARELGLEDQFLGTNDHLRNVFVLHKGKPVVLPDGVALIVPTQFMPFVLSPLISPLGKIRMGMDWFIPAKQGSEDETLADFVRRRLGSEALDKLAEPLLSGIYNAEAERQSLLATFPRFRELEQQYGSLIRGTLTARRQQPTHPTDNKLPAFITMRSGTHELIKALLAHLSGELRSGAAVQHIAQDSTGTYRLNLGNGETQPFDAVILTTPAFVSADLVRAFAPEAAKGLDAIRYVSTGTIALAYRQSDIPHPLKGFGVVIPRSEYRPINAITVSSTKFDHRAPEGFVLMRVFFGGSRSPQSMLLDDHDIVRMVRSELHAILGIEAAPLFHRIYRWENANPQYDVGHLAQVAAIEAALPPGLKVTGSAYRGVGLPDCVYQAQQTAQAVLKALKDLVTLPTPKGRGF